MKLDWQLLCDDTDVAVQCVHLADALGIALQPSIATSPIHEAVEILHDTPDAPLALALASAPSADQLVSLAHAAATRKRPLAMAIVIAKTSDHALHDFAGDIGLVALTELGPLLSALAFLELEAKHPWTASTRALSDLDRLRLSHGIIAGRGGGKLERLDDGLLGWRSRASNTPQAVGNPTDVGEALAAIRTCAAAERVGRAVIEGVERQAVDDVIFGPPRRLSDPASKAALLPYGLPLPLEELCTSPSRAASEASRIGFPVRIALASPDLRVWDHPDLAADDVDNAARVRDVYRQIMAMASERSNDARLLGVHVTATTQAKALLTIRTSKLSHQRVRCEIAFADPHGKAARDRTLTALPASYEQIERVVGRLRGAGLVLGDTPSQRRASLSALTEVFLRLSAFHTDYAEEIEEVILNPIALLVGGAAEVREACVVVGDAYLRTLDAPQQLRSAG